MDSEKTVDASPVKSFFVQMLTRDIELIDAILDLLDNCVDGILRHSTGEGERPYEGYLAEISFTEESFQMKDNCGGIPWKLSDYAFRMGRLDENRDEGIHTVGTYGIGMKRAIFKMGDRCVVRTQTAEDAYKVVILPEWVRNQIDWRLPREREPMRAERENGTEITISELHRNIAASFGKNRDKFEADLFEEVKSRYSIIMQKGLRVEINGKPVTPDTIRLYYEEPGNPAKKGASIRPYFYKGVIDDVEVFIAVGFTEPPPSRDELEADQRETKYTSRRAGWTIVCNDRVVLPYDKSRLTGWGEAGVPNYHTQFIAISGLVEFRSNNARKLPMTTTKNGVDAGSEIYLAAKEKMREGLKKFTTFTTKWKGKETEARTIMSRADKVKLSEMKQIAEEMKLSTVRKYPQGSQYAPDLPFPKEEREYQRISFRRKTVEIEKLSNYLFEEPGRPASEIGDKCFEILLKEAEG